MALCQRPCARQSVDRQAQFPVSGDDPQPKEEINVELSKLVNNGHAKVHPRDSTYPDL